MRYSVVKQKPFCCVPASLQMILQRRGLPMYTQEEIGYDLGLSVPPEFFRLFPQARKEKPSSGYGTEIQNPKYFLNAFFEKRNISLREEYLYFYTESEFKKIISITLDQDADIIVCFNNAILNGAGDWGHVSLVESVNEKECTVTVVDPDPEAPDRRIVTIDALLHAIQKHGKSNRAGFWIIRKN